MKRKRNFLGLISVFITAFFLLSAPACASRKSGCPMNEQATTTSKKGKLSTKKGKTSLFPPKKKRLF